MCDAIKAAEKSAGSIFEKLALGVTVLPSEYRGFSDDMARIRRKADASFSREGADERQRERLRKMGNVS